MEHSKSSPSEALMDLWIDLSPFPDDILLKLKKLLPDLVFVETEEVLEKFRCKTCQQIALSPKVTNCDHLLCQTCFKAFLLKNCPVVNCPNPTLNEGKHKLELQDGIRELRTCCIRKEYGCEKIVPLCNLLEHQMDCEFSERKTLPILWRPKYEFHQHYIDQLQQDLNKLRNLVLKLQDKVSDLKEQLSLRQEEIAQLQHNDIGFVSDIRILKDTTDQLTSSTAVKEQTIQKLIEDRFNEIWNTQKELMIKEMDHRLKSEVEKAKRDLLMDISGDINRKFDRDKNELKSEMFDEIAIKTNKMPDTTTKDFQKLIEVREKEMSRVIQQKCSNGQWANLK